MAGLLTRLVGIEDLLVTRIGDVFSGEIKNKSFQIVVDTGEKYKFKRAMMARITYKNLPYYPADEVILQNGQFSGATRRQHPF